MNGLLRRLAEQAIGGSSPVRSMVRLPFVSAPPFQEAHSMERSPDLGLVSVDQPASGMSSLQPTARVLQPESVDSTSSEPAAAEPTKPSVGRLTVSSLLEQPPWRRRFNQSPLLDAAPIDTPMLRTGDIPSLEEEPLANPERIPHREARQPTAQQHRSIRNQFVEPLLPPQSASIPSPAGYGRGVASGQERLESSTTTDDAIEVHVSIGRIEVTAVQEAPRPKKEPVPTHQPMTLEEYLAKRGGSRP